MNGVRSIPRGVTLVELLVVLVIVAILSTIAMPVYLNRVETAKFRTAQAEVRELAMAEDVCAAIHGFYVPLQTLDDLPYDNAVSDTFTDDLANEPGAIYLFDTSIPPSAQALSLGGTQPQLQDRVASAANFNLKVKKMYDQWQGPFINFNRFFMGYDTGNDREIRSVVDSSSVQVSRDFPLDPWGIPYRIFSPLGITGSGSFDATVTAPSTWDSDTKFNLILNNSTGDSDPYDRWAIVSYGPDQEPDSFSGTDEPDDIVYMFGYIATETPYVR